jgi:hypothetical protein
VASSFVVQQIELPVWSLGGRLIKQESLARHRQVQSPLYLLPGVLARDFKAQQQYPVIEELVQGDSMRARQAPLPVPQPQAPKSDLKLSQVLDLLHQRA